MNDLPYSLLTYLRSKDRAYVNLFKKKASRFALSPMTPAGVGHRYFEKCAFEAGDQCVAIMMMPR